MPLALTLQFTIQHELRKSMNLTPFAVPFLAFALAGCMSDQDATNFDNPADRTAGDSSAVTPQTTETGRTARDIDGMGSPSQNQAPADDRMLGR
jgi:hypothetical protein